MRLSTSGPHRHQRLHGTIHRRHKSNSHLPQTRQNITRRRRPTNSRTRLTARHTIRMLSSTTQSKSNDHRLTRTRTSKGGRRHPSNGHSRNQRKAPTRRRPVTRRRRPTNTSSYTGTSNRRIRRHRLLLRTTNLHLLSDRTDLPSSTPLHFHYPRSSPPNPAKQNKQRPFTHRQRSTNQR